MTTDEEKISRLYQENKDGEPNEAPPAQLDSDILKAAHQAVEKKSSSVKSPFSGGWPAAASIAAVLIITVILVPLIRQDAVTPTTKSIVDKKLEILNEQDVKGQSNNAKDIKLEANRQATMKSDVKEKKQSLAKEQTRRLAPTLSSREKSSETPQEHTFVIEKSMSDEAMPEEAMLPMETDIASSPQAAKPATVPIGKSNLYDDEIKAEAEFQQAGSPMLTADKVSAITLTPKLWLEKIRQLIRQGKLDLARKELDQFKTRYPHEAIDQSIIDELKLL